MIDSRRWQDIEHDYPDVWELDQYANNINATLKSRFASQVTAEEVVPLNKKQYM